MQIRPDPSQVFKFGTDGRDVGDTALFSLEFREVRPGVPSLARAHTHARAGMCHGNTWDIGTYGTSGRIRMGRSDLWIPVKHRRADEGRGKGTPGANRLRDRIGQSVEQRIGPGRGA